MPPGFYERPPAIDRFMAKVQITDGCWLWTASQQGQGYGQFWTGERLMLAHRWSYEHFIGPIPEGLTIDHVKARGCVHRHCVNPEHLEAVTHRENLLRGDTRTAAEVAQTHCLRGHPLSGENLHVRRGKRECRACTRLRDRERYRKKRARSALLRRSSPGKILPPA